MTPAEARVSALAVLCPANQVTPRPLTLAEIDDVVTAFGAAAQRAQAAGFDALEVPFSHGYLIHQFLSPHTNWRTDEYGGALENRLRFGCAVLTAVRAAVGSEFPLVVRLNARDYIEGGLELADALVIARELATWGVVDGLGITSGTMCESVPYCMYPTGTPKANLLPMAAQIRTASGCPCLWLGASAPRRWRTLRWRTGRSISSG